MQLLPSPAPETGDSPPIRVALRRSSTSLQSHTHDLLQLHSSMHTPRAIHEIYSKELFKLRHGYPIWDPEPEYNVEDGTVREVEVGVVGFLDAGRFLPLFHTTRSADDSHQKYGVPLHFEQFVPPPSMQEVWPIESPVLTSEATRTIPKPSIDRNANLPGIFRYVCSLGTGLRYTRKEHTSALLVLQTPVDYAILTSKPQILQYMRQNFDHWLEFANDEQGMDLRFGDNEIYFVHGTRKTSRWACGAHEGRSRSFGARFNAHLYAVASLDVGYTLDQELSVRKEFIHGPSRQHGGGTVPTTAATEDADAAQMPLNQTVFIHYHKAKRRRISRLKHAEAAAGKDMHPSSNRNRSRASSGSKGVTGSTAAYDPVNFLLDYILDHSAATIAIACDVDLYALFHDVDLPSDIPTALSMLRPTIDVDEGGGSSTSLIDEACCADHLFGVVHSRIGRGGP
ncbi:hypothetical protein C8Q77DRAFT_1132783 [Trametes polyzona]|nr:hypothetical protein C8Q77DRAFT_1132783 [Trametes polyzona]